MERVQKLGRRAQIHFTPALWGETTRGRKLFFVRRRPAHARSVSWFVELALDHVRTAAVVEAKDLVVGVEDVRDERKALLQAHTALHIDLQVAVQIGVAERPFYAAGRSVLILIGENVCLVVAHAEPVRETALVIGRAYVPSIRRLPKQMRVVRTPGESLRTRVRIAVVR